MITSEVLARLLPVACQRLKGDWVLMGGSLLPALGLDVRQTTDIDLVPGGQDVDSMQLMLLADELGLPLECINQSAVVYLQRVGDFRSHLVTLFEGSSATIFRPDGYLYVRLKLGRLNPSDLSDCITYLRYLAEHHEPTHRDLLLPLLETEIAACDPKCPRFRRLMQLVNAITEQ